MSREGFTGSLPYGEWHERTTRRQTEARARRERDSRLTVWAARKLEGRLNRNGPLYREVVDESREKRRAWELDLGGEENCSAKEHTILETAQSVWITLQLVLLALLQNPASESAVELYSKIGTLAGTLKGLLEAVGLERRAREVEDLQTYLARQRNVGDREGDVIASDPDRPPAEPIDDRAET